MGDNTFQFIPPPECPVFKPTLNEFRDPLEYIAKIRPIAEKTGICKIIPPTDWNPPFAVDIKTFKFTPRIQKLNELEAHSRVKLFFLDSLAKFWELQGHVIKVPNVERKILDLFKLRKVVIEEGGYEIICRERKWMKVAQRLGYPHGRHVGSTLRSHYEKIIYPYDIFKSGASFDIKKIENDVKIMQKEIKNNDEIVDYKPIKKETTLSFSEQEQMKNEVDISKVGDQCEQRRQSSRLRPNKSLEDEEKIDFNKCTELKKLQFIGAGPKMAVPEKKEQISDKPSVNSDRIKTRDKGRMTYIDHYMCQLCGRGDDEAHMLLCDGCDDAFHTKCLFPPVTDIPKGDWRCPDCISRECKKTQGPYGFFQAMREYSLCDFGEKSDEFKTEYFGQPAHTVPRETVETEFWRLVNTLDEDVCVEYGADIHSMEMGSGFPTEKHTPKAPDRYKNCKWNLNNLSVLQQSLLRHVPGNVSGMKVPWCYVGMCFSSFAWHTEDHWSYSINYLHWGEPKTWYGVPGNKAEMLENCMKQYAPELFEQSPDLLHQLTTIMNPNTLMAYGVPIVRADQRAGEFMITFPRAYHAGFNQGFNFAEAVNFTPPDWLHKGRECVNHYSQLGRYCVFSHDELVIVVSKTIENLDICMITNILIDLKKMRQQEMELRNRVTNYGIVNKRHVSFSLKQDDERICNICKTTLYLSAVVCNKCSRDKTPKLYCLNHFKAMCNCSVLEDITLLEGISMDEIDVLICNLSSKTNKVDDWTKKVNKYISENRPYTKTFNELMEFKDDAIKWKFPKSETLIKLQDILIKAEKCETVASQLSTIKIRTRQRNADSSNGQLNVVSKPRVTFTELVAFVEQIDTLPCTINHGDVMRVLLKKVTNFITELDEALNRKRIGSDVTFYENLLEKGINLDVGIPKLIQLKDAILQCRWLNDIDKVLQNGSSRCILLHDIKKMMNRYINIPSGNCSCEEAMSSLQELLNNSEDIEENAVKLLNSEKRQSLDTFLNLAEKAKSCNVYLENLLIVEDIIEQANEWIEKLKSFENNKIFIGELEILVKDGKNLPIYLKDMPKLESYLNSANSWLKNAQSIFIRDKAITSLLSLLLPNKLFIEEFEKEQDNNYSKTVFKNGEIFVKFDKISSKIDILNEINKLEIKAFKGLSKIRLKNLGKFKQIIAKSSEFKDYKICVCKLPASGIMLQCSLCCELYHSDCIIVPKQLSTVINDINSGNFQCKNLALRIVKNKPWLCSSCNRSKRPNMDIVNELYLDLRNVNYCHIREEDALNHLLSKANNWKFKALELLDSSEVKIALTKIEIFSKSQNNIINLPNFNKTEFDINDIQINSNTYEKLEKLLIEGNMLEIFVDEINTLWKIFANVVKENAGFCPIYLSDIFSDKNKVVKKRKSITKINELAEKPKKKKGKKKKDEEDELCEALPCLKPYSKREILSWVQCDKCNGWFHLVCVGIKENELKDNDDYICTKCKNRRLIIDKSNASLSLLKEIAQTIKTNDNTNNNINCKSNVKIISNADDND